MIDQADANDVVGEFAVESFHESPFPTYVAMFPFEAPMYRFFGTPPEKSAEERVVLITPFTSC
jgi:hypothetical protein